MVCVEVDFANLSWHFFLSSPTIFACAIFGMLSLIGTLQWEESKLKVKKYIPYFSYLIL